MYVHIFGYGSLLNQESLQQTSQAAEIVGWTKLQGYQRKMNAVSDAFPDVALNIVPQQEKVVEGVLVKLPVFDLPALRERETGYDLVEVTDLLDPAPDTSVFTFIAPDVNEYQGKKVYREYLDICLSGVPEHKRDRWLTETIIECEITKEDRQVVYEEMS